MGQSRGIAILAILAALTQPLTGCNQSQEKSSQGLFAVALSAAPSAVQDGAALVDDGSARLLAAKVTVAGIEARRSDGTFVPVDGGFPVDVDLVSLAREGGMTSLPADLLPEGPYTALHVRMTSAALTLPNGDHVTISPPGNGWSAIIPADFSIGNDRATIVDLNLRVADSVKLVGGAFEFDPELELKDVIHD